MIVGEAVPHRTQRSLSSSNGLSYSVIPNRRSLGTNGVTTITELDALKKRSLRYGLDLWGNHHLILAPGL